MCKIDPAPMNNSWWSKFKVWYSSPSYQQMMDDNIARLTALEFRISNKRRIISISEGPVNTSIVTSDGYAMYLSKDGTHWRNHPLVPQGAFEREGDEP